MWPVVLVLGLGLVLKSLALSLMVVLGLGLVLKSFALALMVVLPWPWPIVIKSLALCSSPWPWPCAQVHGLGRDGGPWP